MALPPTPLTTLLYGAPTPDAMYDALESANCLSRDACTKRNEVVALLSGVIERSDALYAAQPGLVGPSAVDQIARELVSSSYLSSRGKEMSVPDRRSNTVTQKVWWHFWK